MFEQLPAKCLSISDNLLSASLKPLTNYIDDLALSKDSMVSKQARKVQLSFSIAQASFKDILPVLTYLIARNKILLSITSINITER